MIVVEQKLTVESDTEFKDSCPSVAGISLGHLYQVPFLIPTGQERIRLAKAMVTYTTPFLIFAR